MPPRIIDLTDGLTMVISDLHGDREAFARYVGRFLQLWNRKKVQRLLLLGDLIHNEGATQVDDSLQIVLDVFRIQKVLPPNTRTILPGTHQSPPPSAAP